MRAVLLLSGCTVVARSSTTGRTLPPELPASVRDDRPAPPPWSALATASSSPGAASPNPFARFEFSWALPPVQAFPGASSRMLTDSEVDGFTRNFSSMMIWGLNSTCLSPSDNVTTFPAYCANSWCQCYPDRGHALEQQRFVAGMDAALQAQGAALKARAAALGLAPRPTLGYIDFTSPQQTFLAQNQLREDPALGALRCALESPATGLIDCMAPAPKGGCCEQGSEFAIYDFRQQAARDYFVGQVLPPLIDGAGLDGTFLDSVDWFLTFGCGGRWTCTDAEREGLVDGSLQALDASLAYAASKGKLLSVSSHNSLGVNRGFYEAQLAMIAAHGNAWRFYEGFEVTHDGLATYLFEAQGMNVSAGGAPTATNYSLPVMMHTGYDGRHDSPDWVELAAFLIGASENSYFSYSGGHRRLPHRARVPAAARRPARPADRDAQRVSAAAVGADLGAQRRLFAAALARRQREQRRLPRPRHVPGRVRCAR
jgi:hypothetical protein